MASTLSIKPPAPRPPPTPAPIIRQASKGDKPEIPKKEGEAPGFFYCCGGEVARTISEANGLVGMDFRFLPVAGMTGLGGQAGLLRLSRWEFAAVNPGASELVGWILDSSLRSE